MTGVTGKRSSGSTNTPRKVSPYPYFPSSVSVFTVHLCEEGPDGGRESCVSQ